MLQPLYLETGRLLLHPFRPAEFSRYQELIGEIFALLSHEETLRFIPEKRLKHRSEAERWLKAAVLNAHAGRNTVHFISDKSSGKLVGIVDIIPPAVAREHYRLAAYPHFIEFYLKAECRGKAVMSSLLPEIIKALNHQHITQIAAVVNRRNAAASKVLQKCGFSYRCPFDGLQDFYQLVSVA
ncbi:GNAT family N-acetyltransferase [Mucilaginibacter corticis]|uniref:GNAT family N-acetyltransferase n=1 Tax=Mucilaginibacter corticis TaxID=2597670 RepID=A0A556MX47_9SPHI|nr:GNAT family N-acetyltransferase [Mucilaginibacter corticis]TSJ44487.1 GNAT family N-acetyltransferase [Mucilaginibacter corticis]